MEYRILVQMHGKSAKNKGLIVGRWTHQNVKVRPDCDFFTLEARDNADAFAQISSLFMPNDHRPLAGKSYLPSAAIKPKKLGQKVELLTPYAAVLGSFDGYREGVVSEVLGTNMVSVKFEGYHTDFVDFNLAELR